MSSKYLKCRPGKLRFPTMVFDGKVVMATHLRLLWLLGSFFVMMPAARALSAPEIVDSPLATQTVARGGAITLNVVALGDGLMFQWLENGVPLDAETTATLRVDPVERSAVYHAVVSNEAGSASSAPAVVLVTVPGENSPPIFTNIFRPQIRQYQMYREVVLAADPDGDAMTFSIKGEVPSFLEIKAEESALVFAGVPENEDSLGWHEFTVSVSDNRGGIAEQTVSLQVDPAVDLPRIESFEVEPAATIEGEPVVLRWNVDDADSLAIDQGVGDVTGLAFVEVFPEASTTYTLTARNENGPTRHETTVEVNLPPVIETFRAETTTLVPWKESRLSWSVTGAATVTIQPSIGVVEPSGSMVVAPLDTTRYRLQADNPFASVITAVQIEVDPAFANEGPLIVRRPASHSVGVGETVVLSVEAEGVGPMRFQWRKNGKMLPMETRAQLILESVALSESGAYSVWVGDGEGVTASPDAQVTVVMEPAREFLPVFAHLPSSLAFQQNDYVYETTAAIPDTGTLAEIAWLKRPAWLQFESLEGGAVRFFGKPASHDIGMHELVLQAIDGESGAVTTLQSAIDVPPNSPPVAIGFADMVVPEDHGRFSANLFDAFADAEHAAEELVYALVHVSNEALFEAVEIVDSVSASNLVMTPAPNAHGASTLTIRATDPGSLSAESVLTVVVTPVNDRPVAEPADPIHADEAASDVHMETASLFSDVDHDDSLLYSVREESGGAIFANVEIDPLTGTLGIAFAPYVDGRSAVTVRATDLGGLFAETTVDVIVPPIPDPEVLVGPPSHQRLGRKSYRIEQDIFVKNNAARAIGGFRLAIDAPSGILIDGRDHGDVLIRESPMAPGEEVALSVAFNASSIVTNWNPRFMAEPIVPDSNPAPQMPVEAFGVTHIRRLVNGAVLITFESRRGLVYGVQYVHDGQWRDALHDVRATGRNAYWVDGGPPDTPSHPSGATSRVYRVIRRAP